MQSYRTAEFRDPEFIRSRFRRLAFASESIESKLYLFSRILDRTPQHYAERSCLCHWIPGRIELLGKHTDYCGGRSLLVAVDRGICLLAWPRDDQLLHITDALSAQTERLSLSPELPTRQGHWSNYPRAVARRLTRNFGPQLRGARVIFAGDLPRAAGMSSSSVLVTAVAVVLIGINQLSRHPAYQKNIPTEEKLAEYLGCIENGLNFGELEGDRGVGTFGGSQDHTAILCSRQAEARQYRFGPIRLEETVAWPPDYSLTVGVSGVHSKKTGAALPLYNRISQRARRIVHIYNGATGQTMPHLQAILSQTGLEEVRRIVRASPDEEFSANELTARLNQFAEESNQIVPLATRALRNQNWDELSRLVDRSQQMAGEQLENQVAETVFLAAEARRLGAIAASAFGAGFGGSVWALLPREQRTEFLKKWRTSYRRNFSQSALRPFFATVPSAGARQL